MRKIRVSTVSTAAIVAVMSLVVVSCGGDGDDATTASDSGQSCPSIESDDADHDDEEADHDDEEADHDDEEADHDEDEADHDEEAFTAEDVELTFEIEMTEFAFGCDLPDIPAGTIVAIHFTNSGSVEHEAVIGDADAQDDAEAVMLEMAESGEMSEADDGDEHGHEVPSITVAAGEEGELIFELDDSGELTVGCHIAGHWDAGMHSDFEVV